MLDPVRIGIIGCGTISAAYLTNLKTFDDVEVVSVADLDRSRAQARAEQFEVPKVDDVDGLLADKDVEIVINLTIPKAHFEVAAAVLESGKSVYNEKPLVIGGREEGRKLLEIAKSKSQLVGCAPDTFMGKGLQSCRKFIDEGGIGEPMAASAFMTHHGVETWHPDPEFYYKPGGGPMFDMGPYYLTHLVNLVGPARRVSGSAKIGSPERTITSKPKYGTKVKVEVPTHVTGIVDFVSGTTLTMITSFEIWASTLPRIEIYGTEGSLSVPDPNMFGGSPTYIRPGEKEWSEIPAVEGYDGNMRGVGVVDMAQALRRDGSFRASGELAFHVLDIMYAFHDSSDEGRWIDLTSSCERPEPLIGSLE